MATTTLRATSTRPSITRFVTARFVSRRTIDPEQCGKLCADLFHNSFRHSPNGSEAARRAIKHTYLVNQNDTPHRQAFRQVYLGRPGLLV
jgi:hypothetical protein